MNTTFVQKFEARADRLTGGGATDDEIRDAEKILSIKIEGGYIEFLRRFGWGGVGGLELYGLGKDVPPHLDLVSLTLSERSEMIPRLNPKLIPIMNDGGGNLYCLDTRVSGENPIVFWDHEADAQQEAERVADSFSDWFSEELDRQ